MYEKVGMQYLNVPLLKPSAKDLFFKSVCVYLAYGDYNDAKSKYEFYTTEDPTLLETREDQFMKNSIQAMEEKNLSLFKEGVTKYKQYIDFDKWKVNVFKRIHDNLDKAEKPEEYL